MACASRLFPTIIVRNIPRILCSWSSPYHQPQTVPYSTRPRRDRNKTLDNYTLKRESIQAVENFDSNLTVERMCSFIKDGYRVDELVHSVTLALFKDVRFDEAVTFVRDIVDKKIQIQPKTYTAVLVNCNVMFKTTKNLDADQQMFSFISFMNDNGYTLQNKQSYHVLVMAAASGKFETASRTFDQLLNDEKYSIGLKDYVLLFKSYFNNAKNTNNYDKWNEVSKCFNDMIGSGFHPSKVICKDFTYYAQQCGEVQEARVILGKLQSKGLSSLISKSLEPSAKKMIDNLSKFEVQNTKLNQSEPVGFKEPISEIGSESGHEAVSKAIAVAAESVSEEMEQSRKISETVITEEDSVLENFDPVCAAEMISIFHSEGLLNSSDMVDAVTRELLKNKRSDESWAFLKELKEKQINI